MNSEVRLHRSLTLWPVVLFGLAYMVPMTVFSTYGVVAQTTHGQVAASYVVALVGMFFTALSYGKMVRAYPFSGSAYTYTQKSMSPQLGFLVGWAVLMDYLFLPMINYLLAGIFLSAALPGVPAWIWIILFNLLATVINILGLRLAKNVNLLLILFQVLIMIIFVGLSIRGLLSGQGAGTLLSTLPFNNPDGTFSMILAGASILCLSFLGFDAVSTFTEETIEPSTTIPKGILLVTMIGGIMFIIVSYFTQLVYPDYNSFTNPDAAAFDIARFIGGNLFASIFIAGYVVGCFASALSAQASVARLLYAMGRDGVLPKKVFGYIHPTYRTPMFNLLLVTLFSLTALVLDLVTAVSFINFGALVAFTFVNLSVIAHYFVREKKRTLKDIPSYLILPLIGAIVTFWLWTSLDKHAILLGAVWAICGILYLAVLTKMFRLRPPEFDFSEMD
ncbi:Putrescine importer PuuP [Kyrpidia spormannii]|uniref:Putrescine importer PuuP n=1 Tax=Kyrpidia spormannii TaxID=2055160 RepID=A0A2K8N9S2_9BACL|nr:APC family permease [Kyrpidia spormannii]ATY86064.1 Putrescine importer PuuP [Kyrpidia spormannii]